MIPITLASIFDMIFHDSKEFPTTLNLQYLLMQHNSQAHSYLKWKIINQTVEYITKWKLIIANKYYEYIYTTENLWILYSECYTHVNNLSYSWKLQICRYENLPKSLSSHKNDMPKILHYKNFYYNSA